MTQNYEHSLSEVLRLIEERDKEDQKIDEVNRSDLQKKGFKLKEPKKFLDIDTGETVGAGNVVREIKQYLDDAIKVIALEGLSGAGKSTTAKHLKEEVPSFVFSMGEVFRYLAYMKIEKATKQDISEIVSDLRYNIEHHDICLCRISDNKNITHELKDELVEPYLVAQIPEKIASKYQAEVIGFVDRGLQELKQKGLERKIIIDGRAFTLDFLSCDLRVRLHAEAIIRAKRRLNQDYD